MPELIPTRRLYFDDAYLMTFEARLVALADYDGRPAAVLDATAFYPDGGGQPADHGTLAGVAVTDVQERDAVIYHLLAAPLDAMPGAPLSGTIDWPRRFAHMQQHTGQHTLSAAFFRLLGAETKSWHLGADYVTVDIGRASLADAAIADAAIADAEEAANAVLWDDVPVTARVYDRAALAELALRKGSDREGGVRVVSIGDWDRIGCGGTHVASAGRVGAIAVRRWETRGPLTRVEFLCGGWALAAGRHDGALLRHLGAALSAKPGELRAQVDRLITQTADQREQLDRLQRRLLEYDAQALLAAPDGRIADRPLIVRRLDDRDQNALRFLAQRIAELGGVALLGAVADGRALLAFAGDKTLPLDLGAALKAALPLVGGKGGGQRFQAQGGGPEVAGLDAALQAARAALAGR